MINQQLSGRYGDAKPVYGTIRTMAALTEPSQAIFCGDSLTTSTWEGRTATGFAYRHGGHEIRPVTTGAPDSVVGSTGKANFIFMDGHAAPMGYFELFQRTSATAYEGYSSWRHMCTGFDANR